MAFTGYTYSRLVCHLTSSLKFRKTSLTCNNVKGIYHNSFANRTWNETSKCTFATTSCTRNGKGDDKSGVKETFEVTFIKPNGTRLTGKGKEGDSILDVVVNNHLDIEGYGQCEGNQLCGTCHVAFVKKEVFDLTNHMFNVEASMLLRAGQTETSRLGCQVQLTKKLGNFEVILPKFIKDLRNADD